MSQKLNVGLGLIPGDILESLTAVIEYLWEEEKRDFDIGDDSVGHIFPHVRRMKEWVADQMVFSVMFLVIYLSLVWTVILAAIIHAIWHVVML